MSGFILMAHKLPEEKPAPSDEGISEYLVGDLCRCAAYAVSTST
ncbi:2Fe-2S iron-sulfur cluster-binding protein [Bradyrhizobium liaoningense]